MNAPESKTSADEALSSLMGAVLGTHATSQEDSIPIPAYGSPADVALRIRDYIGKHGRENTATLLLYEAMNALPRPDPAAAVDARNAERYRTWRDMMIASNYEFRQAVADALPKDVGDTRPPTAAEWDAAIDAAIAAQQGKGCA